MAIKAYVGRMGSGKSYEVVSVVILEALRRGRRVVSNIAGLDALEMRELLIEEGCCDDAIGELVHVEHDAVLDPKFWRTDKDAADGVEAFILPGDLLALDEIWRFWSGFAAKDMPARVMNFFRMHRHFADPETGVTCDVALITQDVGDIARRVRAVIEETYRMEKLTAIGSSSRYRVDVFSGGKTTGKPLRQIQRKYDPRYFALYSSHSQKQAGGASAKEENIDARGNILKGALFRVVLPLGLVVAAVAVWTLVRFFSPPAPEKAPEKPADGKPGSAAPATAASKPGPDRPRGLGDISESWRVVGHYTAGNRTAYLLVDGAARTRLLYDVPGARHNGLLVQVRLPEGGYATTFSGPAPGRRREDEGTRRHVPGVGGPVTGPQSAGQGARP